MTREEAIIIIERVAHTEAKWPGTEDTLEALDMAVSALRTVSREQVENVWIGEWQMVSNGSGVCSECHRQDKIDPLAKFCRYCGAALTDEAVEMVLERMETINNA